LDLGDGDFLAAPIGQSDVFDEVVHTLGFPLIWASDDKDIKKSLYEFASGCQGEKGGALPGSSGSYGCYRVRRFAGARRSASELPDYGLTHSPSEVSTERLTTACVRN